MTSCRSRWYIQMPKLTFVWKVIDVVSLCVVSDGFAIVSRIGETYPTDERSHTRLGGYDPSTYQWVGFCFQYIYINDVFPRNVNRMIYESNGFYNWIAMSYANYVLYLWLWLHLLCTDAEDGQVSQVSTVILFEMMIECDLVNHLHLGCCAGQSGA